jgi:phytoene dehydrogenase-like protein
MAGVGFDFDVIVVGAGIGGLTAAALLASRGRRVLVVESHYQCGGNCTSWRRLVGAEKRPFIFDSGVQDISGTGEGRPLANLLSQIGAALEWRRVHHLYWDNGLRIAAGLSHRDFIAALAAAFPPEADGIARFFDEMAAVHRDLYAETETTGGVPAPPPPAGLRAWAERHPHATRWMRERFADMLGAYTTDPHLQRILHTVSEYIATTPERLSVHDMAPLYGYYFEGGSYPRGGAQSIANTLAASLRDHGGRLALRTRVERILVDSGRVTGVRTARGDTFTAPVVIANGDVVSMLLELTGSEHLPDGYARRVATLRRGPSALLVSLGLNTIMDLPPRVFIRDGDLAFGMGNPSVLDPGLAPGGHSAVTLLQLLPESEAANWGPRNEAAYHRRKAQAADRLIETVERSVFPAIRQHIIYQEAATPATFTAYTGARNGNIYGAARAVWRPRLTSPLPGLYLTGAGTDTGAGIEAVVISGTRTADAVTAAG